jgi:hypothetical protein
MNSTIAAPSLLPHTEGAAKHGITRPGSNSALCRLTAPTHVPHRERTSSRDARR